MSMDPPLPTLYSDNRQVHLLRGHAWHSLSELMVTAIKPLLIDNDPMPTMEANGGAPLFQNPLNRVQHNPMDDEGLEQAFLPRGGRLIASAIQPNSGLGDLAVLLSQLKLQHMQVEADPSLAAANSALTGRDVLQMQLGDAVGQMAGHSLFHFALGLALWDDQPLGVIQEQVAQLKQVLHPRGFIVHFADLAAPPRVAQFVAAEFADFRTLPHLGADGQMEVLLVPPAVLQSAAAACEESLSDLGATESQLQGYVSEPLRALEDEMLWRVGTLVTTKVKGLEGVKAVDLGEYAMATLERALRAEGFDVFLNEVLQKRVFLDIGQHKNTVYGTASKANVFELRRGTPYQGYAPLTPKQAPWLTIPALEQCSVHVTMATRQPHTTAEARALRQLAMVIRDKVTQPGFVPPRPVWQRLVGRVLRSFGR
eukprot:GGOE01019636.1.p1 GENE.GGOE01019636.1~~GGOE01019636.1.p1  ORF type:complete len:425 (-),score=100.26 GGOE01019636.1:84-1358(-)